MEIQQGSSSGGVTSINSLTGAVTLAAGSNITLTPVGNTITIASTGGFVNPMTTTGDTIYSSNNSGTGARLGIGTAGQVLTVSGGLPSWQNATGAVSSVSNVDGTLTISPTTGAVVASLALAHANTWTGQQTFNTASAVFGVAPTLTGFTQGSILFAGASGVVSQDNAQLFWDDTNLSGGIGTNSLNTNYKTNIVGSTITVAAPSAAAGTITYFGDPSMTAGSIVYSASGYYPANAYTHAIRVWSNKTSGASKVYTVTYDQSGNVTDDGTNGQATNNPTGAGGVINYGSGNYVANGYTQNVYVYAIAIDSHGQTQFYSAGYADAGTVTDDSSTNPYYITWSWTGVSPAGTETILGYRLLKYDSGNGYTYNYYKDVLSGGGATTTLVDNGPSDWTAGSTVTPTVSSVKYYINWSWVAGSNADGYTVQDSNTYNSYTYNYFRNVVTNSLADGATGNPYAIGDPTGATAYQANGYDHAIRAYSYKSFGTFGSSTTVFSSTYSQSATVTDDSSMNYYVVNWSYTLPAAATGARVLIYDTVFPHNYDYYYDTTASSFKDGISSLWTSGSTVTPTSGTNGGITVTGSSQIKDASGNNLAWFDASGRINLLRFVGDPIGGTSAFSVGGSNGSIFSVHLGLTNGTDNWFAFADSNATFFAYAQGTPSRFYLNALAGDLSLSSHGGHGAMSIQAFSRTIMQFRTGNTAFDTANAQLDVRPGQNTTVGIISQAGTSQSADLFQTRDVSSNVLTYINAAGNMGVRMGATAATAYLHLAAGTATASTAPLKFITGTVNTTAEAGAMEYANPDLFFTPGSAVRYNLPLVTGAGTQGDLIYASGASIYSRLAKNTTATRYLSNTGTSNNPAWAQIDLTNGVTNALPIANGGTGQTTLLAAGIMTAVSTIALTNQGADITTTTITGTAGTYLISYVMEDTTADLTAGAVTLTFAWTDGAGATTLPSAALLLTAVGRTSGTVQVQLASGNLTYATSHTGIFGTSKYALYISTIRLS